MTTLGWSVYRTAAPPREEPNPIVQSWKRYRISGVLFNFALATTLTGIVGFYLVWPDYLLPLAAFLAALLLVTWKRVCRCRCPVCENPLLGGPYQESRLGPMLGVFPETCSYCDAEPLESDRRKPSWRLRASLLALVIASSGIVFWRIDSSGERFIVRGVVLDPRARTTELVLSTPRGDRKWNDGALRGRVYFTLSIGRISGHTYVHDRVLIWE